MRKILSIFIFCSFTGTAQNNWELLNPKPSFRTGIDIGFVSPTTGYILNEFEILQTLDSGVTWTKKQNISSGIDMHFNNTIGYIVGNYGNVLKTLNSGLSWSATSTGGSDNYNSVTVVDANNIFISSVNKLIKSSNGGATWQTYNIPNGQVNKTLFLTPLIGHAVCENGTILKTIDGGLSWTPKLTSGFIPAGYFTIYFINQNIGFATHEHDDMVKTIDGGETWTPVSGNFEAIYSFSFTTELIGYACGEYGALYKTVNGGNSWNLQSFQPGFIDASTMFGIHFIDDNNGFATGMRGRIIKTTNGGTTWTSYSPTYNDIKKLAFPTSQTGYALIGNDYFKTSDSGNTWAYVGTPQHYEYASSFDFPSENIGYSIGGGTSSPSGSVYKTVDGGTTWVKANNGANLLTEGLYCVDFVNDNIGFASGGFNLDRTFKTINGGNTWQQVNTISFGQMQFLTPSVGYARNVGNLYNRIYKTIDGGVTWNITFEIDEDITSFHFVDENVGYFVGDSGLMYKTTDGGALWEQLTVPYAYYKLVKFYSPTLGYICDDYGMFHRTTNGGLTWTNLTAATAFLTKDILFNDAQIYVAGTFGKILRSNLGTLGSYGFTSDHSQIKIYPNPTTDKITISTLTGEEIESVAVIDMLGRPIIHLDNINIANQVIDLSNKSKGIYLVKIKTKTKRIETKKILVE